MEQGRRLTDVEIRHALKQHLAANHGTKLAMLDEVGLGCGVVRADLIVLDHELHGYEIKSDRDSLTRLARQAELYSHVLDRATLVVGRKLMANATTIVPAWWGIMEAVGDGDEVRFVQHRASLSNPQRDPRKLAEFLWSEEALALLTTHGLDRGLRGKSKRRLWERISTSLPLSVIADAARVNLMNRHALRATASPS
jgi:hypothetical protein